MPQLRVQELASRKGFNISKLQLATSVSMGTMRRYWYGTRDGKAEGQQLTEVDLIILAKIAEALAVKIADLIEEWLARPVAASGQHTTERAGVEAPGQRQLSSGFTAEYSRKCHI